MKLVIESQVLVIIWCNLMPEEDKYQDILTCPLFLVSLWISKSFNSFNHTSFTLPGSRIFKSILAQPMNSAAWIPSSSYTLIVKCWVDMSSTMNSKCSFQIGFKQLSLIEQTKSRVNHSLLGEKIKDSWW